MTNNLCINEVRLSGKVVSKIMYSHDRNGKKIYNFFISVKRFSAVEDVIRVLVSDELLQKSEVQIVEGKLVDILGEYDSHTMGKKFILSVYANEMTVCDTLETQGTNHVVLTGFICKKLPIRETPKGKTIIDVFLAINYADKKTTYVPCIIWGQMANEVDKLKLGDKVKFIGRAQSRKYTKIYENGETEQKTAYEFSVSEYSEETN